MMNLIVFLKLLGRNNKENEEKNIVNVEEKNGFKDNLLKYLDYVIVYATLFILYIVVLVTGLDKMYRYLIFGIISLLFGSYELKKVISSREKKSLIDIILSITWLLLAILQFVSFFVGIYDKPASNVTSVSII